MRRILLLLPLITALTVCFAHVGNSSQTGNAVADRLFALAENGTANDVGRFLKAHPEIDRTSMTKALHISATKNSKEVLQLFINAGGDIEDQEGTLLLPEEERNNDADTVPTTPFYDAALNQKYENAKLLVAHGANINATGFEGDTALHSAVMGNNLDFIKFLMSHGADPKMKDVGNHTPCDIAKEPGLTINNRGLVVKLLRYCK
jgi:ankyrin repeat protein